MGFIAGWRCWRWSWRREFESEKAILELERRDRKGFQERRKWFCCRERVYWSSFEGFCNYGSHCFSRVHVYTKVFAFVRADKASKGRGEVRVGRSRNMTRVEYLISEFW